MRNIPVNLVVRGGPPDPAYTALPLAPTKDWHQHLNLYLRSYILKRVVERIFPDPNPVDLLGEERFKNVVAHVQKAEVSAFQRANSRLEYYGIIAKRSHLVRRPLENKRFAIEKHLVPVSRQNHNKNMSKTKLLRVSQQNKNISKNTPPHHNRHADSEQPQQVPVASEQPLQGPIASKLLQQVPEIPMSEDSEDDDRSTIPIPMESEMTAKNQEIRSQPCSSTSTMTVPDCPNESVATSSGQVNSASTLTSSSLTRTPFDVQNLIRFLTPVLTKLFRQDESTPFRHPVDPEVFGMAKYFDIIKNPMDLHTIKQKLLSGTYEDPWAFIMDVWLVFENAWLYNKKTSWVYRYSTQLSEVFAADIEPLMVDLGYCCGQKYTFSASALECSGEEYCTIPHDAEYYVYRVDHNRPINFCIGCFDAVKGNTVRVTPGSSSPQQSTSALLIRKAEFTETKNDSTLLEPFVTCVNCGRKFHAICALHLDSIWTKGFTCELCLDAKSARRTPNPFRASKLPRSELGNYIEGRVNNFLQTKEAGAGEVIIRLVSSVDKFVEVKPGMKNRYVDLGQLNPTFPYRAKTLLAFEEIDGKDVCFFGFYVQEYGSECPAPNTRRVYIAYIDSVHFFQPKQFRTAVYQEILLSYFDFSKRLGFCTAHIWACPSLDGDDYIFHCHPKEQKIPNPKRLQEWYKKLLDKGIQQKIVIDYQDIWKEVKKNRLFSPAQLPYFEGDFWPKVFEEDIQEDAKTSKPKKKKAKYARLEFENGNNFSPKILENLKKHKDLFFVVRLHTDTTAASLGRINDPDPVQGSEVTAGRDAFLAHARLHQLEFSSLRRAKFSTMALLFELHTPGRDVSHNTEDSQGPVPVAQRHLERNSLEGRVFSLFRCLESLQHAVMCRDVQCKFQLCFAVKRALDHQKACKENVAGGCVTCRRLAAASCYHASKCVDPSCSIPFCAAFKDKERVGQTQRLGRRMQVMLFEMGKILTITL